MTQANDSTQPASGASAKPVTRREILGWAFYDFANSGYSTVVMTTIYSAYFVGVVANTPDLAAGTATFLWTLSMAMAR